MSALKLFWNTRRRVLERKTAKNDTLRIFCVNTCPFCSTSISPYAAQCPACGGSLAPNHLPPKHRIKLRYQLETVLGQGGFGITYRAQDTLLGGYIALKEFFPQGVRRIGGIVVVQPPLTSLEFAEQRERFVQEAQTLAQFNHPGIVKVLDVFEEGGTAYYAMELLEGETLGQRLERQGALLGPEVESLALRLGQALERVHSVDLLHRDLKPDNVMLTQDGRAVLIDFGSARKMSLNTSSMTRLVSSGYSPLEQYATQARFGPPTDLYALGGTLYHALLGKAPPGATDRAAQLASLEPLPASTPFGLVQALEGALKMNAGQRPQSVGAFLSLIKPGGASQRSTRAQGHLSGWQAHSGAVLALALSPEGDQLASASEDGRILVWSLEEDGANRKPIQSFTEHFEAVTALHWSAFGLISGSSDGQVLLRRSGQKGSTPLTRGAGVVALSLRPGQAQLAIADDDRRVRVWDLEGKRFLGPGNVLPHWIGAMAYCSDGERLLVGLHDGRVAQLEGSTAQLLELHEAHSEQVTALTVSSTGALASSARDGSVVWWSPEGELVSTLRHSTPLLCLAFDSTGLNLFLGDEEGELWYSSSRGSLEGIARGIAPLHSISHGPSAEMIYLGTQTGQIVIHHL